MKPVVVMPTCFRPEMLSRALRSLKNSKQPKSVEVHIFADVPAPIKDVEYVRDCYFPEAHIHRQPYHTSAPSGTWNILESIRQGYLMGGDPVYLIEEDVVIRPEFFTVHTVLQTFYRPLATCGRKERRLYDRCGSLYTNPGACLSRRLIERLIPHINDDYYLRLGAYLDEHFPSWPECSILDDGLIRRVIRSMEPDEPGAAVIYPGHDICAHQGFRFYDRLDIYKNYETTIGKRIDRLEEIIRGIKPGDRYARDFEPI